MRPEAEVVVNLKPGQQARIVASRPEVGKVSPRIECLLAISNFTMCYAQGFKDAQSGDYMDNTSVFKDSAGDAVALLRKLRENDVPQSVVLKQVEMTLKKSSANLSQFQIEGLKRKIKSHFETVSEDLDKGEKTS